MNLGGMNAGHTISRILVRTTALLALTASAHAQTSAAPSGNGAVQPPAATAPDGPVLGKAEEAAVELARGNVAQAIAALTEALKDTGLANDRRASLLNDRAVAYTKDGQPRLALEDFNRAVQLFGEYPAAYNNRGNLLVELGQYNEAIKDYDRAVLLAPGYAAAYSNRANAKLKINQQAEAIRDFTKSIELMPQSAPPLSGRGLAFLSTGKPHAAIRDFSRAVNADARFASAYRNRAEARLDVGQTDEAIEDLSRAVAFDVNNAELYVVRGYAYLNSGNTASAIKDFGRAVELAPNTVPALAARGLANGMAEAFDEAYADLNRALELDPRSAVAFAFRGYVYKQNQQVDVGQKDVETALKLDANRAEVQWASGELEEARGKTDSAVAAMRNALAIEPSWTLAETALKRLGASIDTGEDRVIAGAGIPNWRVVMRGNGYYALNDTLAGVRIPLEMMGEGTPKLIEWEIKKPPYKGYGVLRFAAGRVIGKEGPEDTEQAAIVDIDNAKVLAVQPNKVGAKTSTWTWAEDSVKVASIDGVTDEFSLRSAKSAAEAEAVPAPAPVRREKPVRRAESWAPWDAFGQQSDQRESRRRERRAPKPKSIFDLLFN